MAIKPLCAHDEVCGIKHLFPGCHCPHCMQPDQKPLLPILRRWRKLLDPKFKRAINSNIVYSEGKCAGGIDLLDDLISHLERDGEPRKKGR